MMDNEQVLLRRFAQSRDALAFRELVDEHKNMVFAACRRVLGNQADAEDAAQVCFLKLAEAAGRLKAPISGWLHTVAVRSSIDILRSETARKLRERSVAAPDIATIDARWADVEADVDAALESLPKRLRLPIVLYFLEGLTQEQVAATLGIARCTVATRLERGLEVLRRRLKRAGIVAPAVALAAMLSANAAEAAPAALTTTLGKVALAGTAGAKVAAATGGTLVTLKTAVAIAVVAAGTGAVVVHQATRPPHPAPIAATAPALRTPDAVLDAELTLPAGELTMSDLGELMEEQIGVGYYKRHRWPFVALTKPGKHKVRDVLAAITASAPLTTEVVADRGRMVICLWQKPDVTVQAQMMVLAASPGAVDRCTAARWLEPLGGRDALVQLLKMLADPDARVRYYAAKAVEQGWTEDFDYSPELNFPSHVVPQGTGRVVAQALEIGVETGKWSETQEYMLRIAGALRDPIARPVLEGMLVEELLKLRRGNKARIRAVCDAIGNIGGPEAEDLLFTAMERRVPARLLMDALAKFRTDRTIAWLSKQVDVEMKKGKRGNFYEVASALSISGDPASVRELIRILNVPRLKELDAVMTRRYLASSDTPEARAACLAKFKAETNPKEQEYLARLMSDIPAVRAILFDDLTRGGSAAFRAAYALRESSADPRIVPILIEIRDADARTLRAAGMDKLDQARVKWSIPEVLGRTPGPEAEKALIAMVKAGGDTMSRRSALAALGNKPSPEARELLLAALKDPARFVRISAAMGLAKRAEPIDIDLLLVSARMDRPGDAIPETVIVKKGGTTVSWAPTTKTVWDVVADIGGVRAAGELVAEAVKGNSAAASALISSRDPRCVRALRDALVGDDAKLRALLLDGFDTAPGTRPQLAAYHAVSAVLAELVGDVDEERKVECAELLGWTRDPRATDALVKLLLGYKELKIKKVDGVIVRIVATGIEPLPVTVRRAAAAALWSYHAPGGAGAYRHTADPAALLPMLNVYDLDTDAEVKELAKKALTDWGRLPKRPTQKPRPPRIPDPKNPPDEREFPPPPEPWRQGGWQRQ